MTKEITKAFILQQMEDKFGLREFAPEAFTFLETVIPTYNIEQHLISYWTKYNYKSVTSAPAVYLMTTVPINEKWTVRGYNVVFMAVGAYTVTGIYVQRQNAIPPDAIYYLDMELGQSASYAHELRTPLVLSPGDALYVYVDSYTSTADIRLYLDYEKEIIR